MAASASSKTAAARASAISAAFDRTPDLPARDRAQPAAHIPSRLVQHLLDERLAQAPTRKRGGMAPAALQLLCSLVQG
jgi:hypothetical protein